MQDHMQIFWILFGRVLDKCYCPLVIQTHQLTSIQSIHIFEAHMLCLEVAYVHI